MTRKSLTRYSESEFLKVLSDGPKTVRQLVDIGFNESNISKFFNRHRTKLSYALIPKGGRFERLYYMDKDLDKVIDIAQNQELYLPWYVIDQALEELIEGNLKYEMSCTWNYLESKIGRSLGTKAERDIALKVARKRNAVIRDSGPDFTIGYDKPKF